VAQPSREEIVKILRDERALLEHYHVCYVALFGSVARGEATKDSDVDLLVEFSAPVGLLHFVKLKAELKRLLDRRVDLATPKSLNPQLRDRILKKPCVPPRA
jgi:uncharacterized protein